MFERWIRLRSLGGRAGAVSEPPSDALAKDLEVYDRGISGRLVLALFISDRNSRGSMHVRHIVVHGKNVLEVAFVRKNVDHPGEYMGMEDAPLGCAGFFGIYGAEHAELGMSGLIVPYAVLRGLTVVNVPMPAHYAERDALVQLIFGCVGAGRVHHALQLVFLRRSSAVEQSCWLTRVEMEISFPGIGFADEVILGLLELWVRDCVSVEQSLAVVLVAFDSGLQFGHNGFCLLLVAGLLWP